jgi:hypothetical protein
METDGNGGSLEGASYLVSIAESDANVALIAAAPDLYHLMVAAVVSCEIRQSMGNEDFADWFVRQWLPKANSAIAKARGE